MSKSHWVWMPHAGHFVMGNECRFRLNTYVGGYIVSTVGELQFDEGANRTVALFRDEQWSREHSHLRGDDFQAAFHKRFGWEELGLGRTYETMVFPAMASIEPDAGCCPWVVADFADSSDSDGYTDAASAYAGHLAMCEKWATAEEPS